MIFKLRVTIWLILLLALSAFSLSAQTAAEMDIMLTAKEVNAAGAARFVLDAAELLPAGLSGNEAMSSAYDMAVSKGWIKREAGEAITLKDLSFLVMSAFQFKGGALYSMFHNPRYAYREMVYRKLIQGRTDPSMKVTGARFLQIIGSALSYSGENERLDPELFNIGTGGAR